MSSTVEKAYFVENFGGKDFLLQFGTNSAGDQVMKQQIRETGTEEWRVFVEILLEAENYWKDVESGFNNGRVLPQPPPEDLSHVGHAGPESK